MLLQQKIYISTVSAGQTGKAPSLYARRFLCFRIRFRIRKAVYGSEAAGIKAAAALQSGEDFGSAKDTERCIWRKIRHFSRHVRPRLPKRRALPKRQRPLLPFAQAAVRRPRRLFCRKTFVRRLASWRTCVRRAGRVHIGARENRQIRRFVCRWAAREAFRPPKKEVCKKPPMRSRPSGEGTAIRRGMPSEDAFRRPNTAGGRRILSKYAG